MLTSTLKLTKTKQPSIFFLCSKFENDFSVLQVFWHQKSQREKNEISNGEQIEKNCA